MGCLNSGGVQVRSINQDSLFHKMRANVLNSNTASPQSQQLLRRFDLETRFKKDPIGTIEALDSMARKQPTPELVFTLCELSFIRAKAEEKRDKQAAIRLHSSTAAYAYFYLFDPQVDAPTNEFDPRFRLACDLYNRSLSRLIFLAQRQKLLTDDSLALESVQGKWDVSIKREGFLWQPDDFGYYLFASDFEVQGLTNSYQTFGLGVPLIGVRTKKRGVSGQDKFFANEQSFPVTAFLRMNCGLCAPGKQVRKATLEFYDPLRVQNINVAGKTVPLESDVTTPLGFYLSRAKLDRVALTGLFRTDEVQDQAGLYLVQPYEKGKIPVVMVHGLWSSPLTWMQMFNDLRGDPTIRDHFQFWFFQYPTGNPFMYSAGMLRESLQEARKTFDPSGSDPSLDKMVLVGHSMGGLLSKLMTQSSQDQVWQLVSRKPIDELKMEGAERERIRNVFYFEPQKYVNRVVFIATPHRGSYLSDRPIGRISAKLIALPRNLLKFHNDLLVSNPGAFTPWFSRALPTSVDNLSPQSPIIQTVGTLPLDERVTFHSIVGNFKENENPPSSDGVVPYTSSHLKEADSELVVHSGHEAHMHPLAVLEVRRILLQHLAESGRKTPVQTAALTVSD